MIHFVIGLKRIKRFKTCTAHIFERIFWFQVMLSLFFHDRTGAKHSKQQQNLFSTTTTTKHEMKTQRTKRMKKKTKQKYRQQ